jgi:hypothetical protein
MKENLHSMYWSLQRIATDDGRFQQDIYLCRECMKLVSLSHW